MIDSHCHLDHEPLFNNLDDILKRSKEVGIEKLLTICTTIKSYEKIKELVKKDDIIYGTYGIHPHEAKNDKVSSQLIINEIKKNKKVIGIGETGLDFYYNHSEKEIQKKSFAEHIKAAIKLKIPLIVHSRSAENDTFDILKNYMKESDLKVIIHCFTGSKDFSKKLIDIGCYISISGIITFKNSNELANTVSTIPLDKLLVETDSPYLSPSPNRGKDNEPSNITYTVEKLSLIKNIDKNIIAKTTTNNFKNLFKII